MTLYGVKEGLDLQVRREVLGGPATYGEPHEIYVIGAGKHDPSQRATVRRQRDERRRQKAKQRQRRTQTHIEVRGNVMKVIHARYENTTLLIILRYHRTSPLVVVDVHDSLEILGTARVPQFFDRLVVPREEFSHHPHVNLCA